MDAFLAIAALICFVYAGIGLLRDVTSGASLLLAAAGWVFLAAGWTGVAS